MTNEELADGTRRALERFQQLSPEEQIKRLMESGTIDQFGNVLMGREETIHFSKQLYDHNALCGAGINVSCTLDSKSVTCSKCDELLILHGNPFTPKPQGILHFKGKTKHVGQ